MGEQEEETHPRHKTNEKQEKNEWQIRGRIWNNRNNNKVKEKNKNEK